MQSTAHRIVTMANGSPTRRVAWLALTLVALFAVTPIVWIRFGEISLTLYQVMGAALVASLFLQSSAMKAVSRVLAGGWWLWLPQFGLFLVATMYFARRYPPFPAEYPVRLIIYLTFAIATAASGYILLRVRLFGYLYLVPAISALLFMVLISVQFASIGLDPVSQIQLAIARRNPNLWIFPLFKNVFTANLGEGIQVALRHGIGIAFVAIALLGQLAHRYLGRKTRLTAIITFAGVSACLFIILLTFSRASWLALAAAGFVYFTCSMKSPRRLMVVLYGAFAALFVGVWQASAVSLFVDRIFQAESYDARIAYSRRVWQAITEYPLLGAPRISEGNIGYAHNLILDNWVATGIFGLVPSLLFLWGLMSLLSTMALRSVSAHSQQQPVYAGAAALLTIPLTRTLTIPNGAFELGAWLAMGIAVGVIAFERQVNTSIHRHPKPREHVSLRAVARPDARRRSVRHAGDAPMAPSPK